MVLNSREGKHLGSLVMGFCQKKKIMANGGIQTRSGFVDDKGKPPSSERSRRKKEDACLER